MWNWIKHSDWFNSDLPIEKTSQATPVSRDALILLATPFLDRGIAFYCKGEFNRAIQEYDRAIEIAPRFGPALLQRARAYDRKGQYRKALPDFDLAIQIRPWCADYFYFRACSHAAEGQYDHAIADFGEAILLAPHDHDNVRSRGEAFASRGDHDRAIQDFDQAIRLKPDDLSAFHHRGCSYAAKGEHDRAIHDYNRAITYFSSGGNFFNYWHRGLSHCAQGKRNLAIIDFTKAIVFDPSSSDAFQNRGLCRKAMGDFNGAIEDFEEAVRINPSDVRSRFEIEATDLARIDKLNVISDSPQDRGAVIRRLRERGKEAVRQRDDWERRALSAEARVKELEAIGDDGQSDKRFDTLRRFLAREFHPDHAKAEGIEKLVRVEIFKQVWPMVEKIANGES